MMYTRSSAFHFHIYIIFINNKINSLTARGSEKSVTKMEPNVLSADTLFYHK